MSYIKKNLHPDERVVLIGRPHWIVYKRAFGFAALALAPVAGGFYYDDMSRIFWALAFLLLGLAGRAAIGAWWQRFTVVVAVTNLRVIKMTGFIKIHTIEMAAHMIEAVHVRQSIIERIIGCGDIYIHGNGGGVETLQRFGNPMEIRKAIHAVEHAHRPDGRARFSDSRSTAA